jgi:hypothetical protein
MNLETALTRLHVLEAEQEQIIDGLRTRADAWYRQHSGRTHFHRLQFIGEDATHLHWWTDTRAGGEDVHVPREWFREDDDR